MQAQFDARVLNDSSTGSGDYIGRFHISGIVSRHPGNTNSNATVVTALANTNPWFQSNVTSSDPSCYYSSDATSFASSVYFYRIQILRDRRLQPFSWTVSVVAEFSDAFWADSFRLQTGVAQPLDQRPRGYLIKPAAGLEIVRVVLQGRESRSNHQKNQVFFCGVRQM